MAPAPPDEARALYDLGLRHLAENRYHDAAVALERSNRLRPLPVVTYNLALAYRGMGRYVAAIEGFEQYLRHPDAGAPPERLAAMQEELTDLRRQLVHVTVHVLPREATLTLDGRAMGTLPPGETLTLDPGTHTFEWSAPDHRPERREMPGEAGAMRSFDLRLEPMRDGRLSVEPTPATATVLIDGRPFGAGARELTMPPGEHWVELSAPGYLPVRRSVHVGGTGIARLTIALDREPTPRWILPTAIAGGVVAVAGAIVTAVLLSRPTIPDPQHGSWGDVHEPPGS